MNPGVTVMTALQQGPATRHEIESRTGLSTQQTNGALIGLIQEGKVRYAGKEFRLVKESEASDG